MTQSPNESAWSDRQARTIAAEVRRHRQLRGMSAQQVADRCEELGMLVPRSVIANLESGRRTTVTVAELLVLAEALHVPPAQLVFPVGYQEKVEALPGREVSPIRAVQWFSGGGLNRPRGWGSSTEEPIGAFYSHVQLVAQLQSYIKGRMAARAEYMDGHDRQDVLRERAARLRVELDELESIVAAERESWRGVRLSDRPDLPPESQARRERLSELREEESSVRNELKTIRYLGEEVKRYDGYIAAVSKRLADLRAKMKEHGWIAPQLPDDLYEFVTEKPWQPSLDFFPEMGVDESDNGLME